MRAEQGPGGASEEAGGLSEGPGSWRGNSGAKEHWRNQRYVSGPKLSGSFMPDTRH